MRRTTVTITYDSPEAHLADWEANLGPAVVTRATSARMSEEQPKYMYDGVSSAGMRRAAALFWPDWVEVEGCVLRAEVADIENARRWLSSEGGSVQRTEWALNHVHLYDEVEEGWHEPPEVLDERLLEAVNRLAAAWRASLAVAFPTKSFAVEVATPEEDHGPTVYVVSSADADTAA